MAANLGLTGVAFGVLRFRVIFLAGVFIFVTTLPRTLVVEVALLDERVEAFSLPLTFADAAEGGPFCDEALDGVVLFDLPAFSFVVEVLEAFFAILRVGTLSSGRMSSGNARRSARVSATLCSG